MAELEAAHKAKQQGATRWREASECANLFEIADVVDKQTLAVLVRFSPSIRSHSSSAIESSF
jgi:hypothetical protein